MQCVFRQTFSGGVIRIANEACSPAPATQQGKVLTRQEKSNADSAGSAVATLMGMYIQFSCIASSKTALDVNSWRIVS